MRILLMIAGLDIGSAHGGAEFFGLELARRLRVRHDVELCAFWQYGTPVEAAWKARLDAEGLPVFFAARWQGRGYFPAYLRGATALLSRARRHPYELTHSHFQFGTVAALTLRVSGGTRRVLRTAHVTLEWGTGPVSPLLRMIFTGWIFPLAADAEIGVSHAVVDRLHSRPAARLLHREPGLIYNGIDLIPPAPLESPPAPVAAAKMISIGRLTAQKDYTTLLSALALASRTRSGIQLTLVGDGDQRSALEQQIRESGLGEQVIFLGQRPDAARLLPAYDLFVLPSLWEGLPTVLLECARAGIPVIATDIPGTRELVEDGVTGWLVPPGDPDRLAQSILSALQNPAAARRCAQAARGRLARYDINRVVEAYEEIYQKVRNG